MTRGHQDIGPPTIVSTSGMRSICKGKTLPLFANIINFAHDKRWKNVVTKSYLYRNVFGDSHTKTVEVYYMTDSHVIIIETVWSVYIVVPSIVL